MIIGITGKSGAGKSFLAEILAEKLNLKHIDVDKISHQVLLHPETQKFLKQEFGEDIFDNNTLNRKKLGALAFKNKAKLKQLNNFCQIQIEKELDKIIKAEKNLIVLDYALLPWLKQFKLCDVKILLKTDFDTRFNRVAARENITEKYFLSRDNSLEDYDETQFDFIYNSLDQNSINKLVEFLA